MNSKLTTAVTAFLFLLTISSGTLYAQTITGTVLDAENREPMIGANIIQVGTSNGVATNTDGFFTLKLLENESPKIRISFVGYKPKTIDISQDQSDLEILLKTRSIMSNEVFVEALRVDEATPMAYENISREQLQKKNLGQDVPYLVSNTPSVVTTSDAGTGIGYTGIRVRGVDPARVNVTINSIPLNDAESHAVFWVNLPDLASSVENIQIQRGVGTSTNGAAAFGATMNLQTSEMRPDAYGEVNAGIGSFNTRKVNAGFRTYGKRLAGRGTSFQNNFRRIY